MDLRTAAMGLSPAKNLRAVSFSICWLSDNPNCIVVSFCGTQQLAISVQPRTFLFLPQRARRTQRRKDESFALYFLCVLCVLRGSCSSAECSITLRQSQHKVANNIALYFRRACFNCVAT